jgi:four helix bundle protein
MYRGHRDLRAFQLADADAEATEVQVWLDFAKPFGYLSANRHRELLGSYEELGKMLGKMLNSPEKFVAS